MTLSSQCKTSSKSHVNISVYSPSFIPTASACVPETHLSPHSRLTGSALLPQNSPHHHPSRSPQPQMSPSRRRASKYRHPMASYPAVVSQACPWDELLILPKGLWTRGLTCLFHKSQSPSDAILCSCSQVMAWVVSALGPGIALQMKKISSLVLVTGHGHLQDDGLGAIPALGGTRCCTSMKMFFMWSWLWLEAVLSLGLGPTCG